MDGMEYVSALIVFILGLVVGSFLNVVILRYNTGRGFGGRSKCLSCVRTLSWYELLPLVSFLALRGRCRGCKAKLSVQYFAVELLTAVVFTLTVARLGYLSTPLDPALLLLLGVIAAFYCAVMAILIVIAVYDLRHFIIPDGLVYTFCLLALIRVGLSFLLDVNYPWYVDIVSGALLALFFASLWYFSRGEWMGFGDAKLALGIGWFLPFSQNVSAVLIAIWSGAAIGLLVILVNYLRGRRRGFTIQSQIPFAPFLIAAFFLTFLFEISFSSILPYFSIGPF